MLRISALFACLLFTGSLLAQTTLFVPRNYLKPYERGTRSWDGKPGPNYWQNRATYTIKAGIEPKTRLLSGEESVVYTNNSPDTLKTIRFKLQHDRYRKGVQRAFDVTPSDVSEEGTRIESIRLNGKEVETKNQNRNATFLDVSIKDSPLAPKSSATFQIKWSYTLPAGPAARECTCDSSSFFVPYWYPQIAVYDDLNGWASHPYTGQQEFYHDFADYDVKITMPAGFQVWATGEWQNARDILAPPYYERWNKAHTASEVIAVFSEAELKKGGVFNKQMPNTFHFVATNVPDFAFGTSDHYNWDATSVVVDDKTARRTFVGAAYKSSSTDYPQVTKIAADGIRMMSTWLPGYPFPYPVMTVFNGDDGMEFPMMCNDASTAPRSPMGLTLHEISHTYFPFMMGINEQDHAWMDEGWAAFFDYLLSDSLSNHTEGGVRDYSAIAGTENDVPPMVKSRNLSTAYRNASYQRPSQAYFTLLDLLGYETFHTCMTEYMNRWQGKHPAPFDFFQTWNQASGQNLDWFWKPWFFDWGYPDLGIDGVVKKDEGNNQVIQISRKGNIPVPLHLEVTYNDGSKQTFHHTAAIWKDGKQNYRINCPAGKMVQSATLGKTTIPDVNRDDNTWTAGK
ncbi:MAG: M1 family metallopeptidase [Chitinophagales bacterium]|nr:M1 family metallopeptidase [Chitinophagales bacterium]